MEQAFQSRKVNHVVSERECKQAHSKIIWFVLHPLVLVKPGSGRPFVEFYA